MAKLKCIEETLLSIFNCFAPLLKPMVCTGKSITRDFPDEMVADIVSRIPIKTIACCMCVCKRWRRLLSEPYFANLHLSRSPAGLIIFQHRIDKCEFFESTELDDKSDHHGFLHDPLTSFYPPHCPDWGYLCGSVNGLIFLWKYVHEAWICNIITREYICLPVHEYIRSVNTTMYGFGFVKATNEYKVVCFYNRGFCSTVALHQSWCEVYTLGTGMWRSLGQVPFLVDPDGLVSAHLIRHGSSDGIFVSGNLHWLVYDQKDTNHVKVCSLDLKKEVFQLSACPQVGEMVKYRRLGMLRDCLCVCDTTRLSELAIWVMKDYGMKESWSKEIVIRGENIRLLNDRIHPLKVFEDGTMLLVSYSHLFTYDPRNKTFKNLLDLFGERGFPDRADAMVFVPSFIRLVSFESEKVFQYERFHFDQ